MKTAAAPRTDADVIDVVAEPVEPASPDTRCGTVYDRFTADPDLMAALHGTTFDIVSAARRGTCVRIIFPSARSIAGPAGQVASISLQIQSTLKTHETV